MRAIDEIYEAILDDGAYARLPQLLCRATGARSAIMIQLDADMQSQAWVQHDVSDAILARYDALDLWRHDIWSHQMARPGYRNRACRSDEVVDVERFRASVFYNELYRPLGDDTARCLGVVLDRPGGSLAIGLHRAYRQPAYDEADAARLQALIPHLRRLSAARGRLQQAERHADLLGATFGRLPGAVLVLDTKARILLANRRAEDLLRAGGGLRVERGCIVPGDRRSAGRFAQAVKSAASAIGDRGGAMRLHAANGAFLNVLVVPLPGPVTGALVLADDHGPHRPIAEVLPDLYGLTPAEAAVASLLCRGCSPAEAAKRRGVSLSTLRSQIQSLLRKTETDRLSDLLRTLGRIAHWAG